MTFVSEENYLRDQLYLLGHYTEKVAVRRNRTWLPNRINSPNRSETLHSYQQRDSLLHSTWKERTLFPHKLMKVTRWRGDCTHHGATAAKYLVNIRDTLYDKEPTSMSDNVLSLRKLITELLGVANEP